MNKETQISKKERLELVLSDQRVEELVLQGIEKFFKANSCELGDKVQAELE
jgi:hypothetical protein